MIANLVMEMGLQTDKTTGHSYGPFYDEALAPYRHRPVRLLEIGVERGDSLKLWHHYFERADIVGVDIKMQPDVMLMIPAVIPVWADAYTERTAESLGDFDIIIDDGPHTLESHLALLRLYLPQLKPGGLLVIEDVQGWGEIDDLASVVPATGYSWEHVDLTAVKGASDDRLFVVRRFA